MGTDKMREIILTAAMYMHFQWFTDEVSHDAHKDGPEIHYSINHCVHRYVCTYA